jgi:peptidoglycan hydrolase-like protein with peptidoglycan-binding domain
LAAFLAIGIGIGTNLLVLQGNRLPSADARLQNMDAFPISDAEKLRRLTIEALGGRETAPPPPVPPVRAQRRSSGREPDASTHRVGSFAPSSGRLALTAMPGADPGEARRATIRAVQTELARRGYEPGPADGAAGMVTRAAVMAYEHDQGLPLTADPSPEVLAHLRHGTSAPGAAIGLEADALRTTGQAELVIRTVQQSLSHLGYLAATPDGLATDDTVRAIREFEMDIGLIPSGRISGPLLGHLSRKAAPPGSR